MNYKPIFQILNPVAKASHHGLRAGFNIWNISL